jgi:hypothetical protein
VATATEIGRRGLLAGLAAAALPVRAAASSRPPPGDLEGTWTLGTYTDFQRPKTLSALVLTPAEAEAYEAPRRALHGMVASKADGLGQAESEFNERGARLARIHGQIRSSWIIDPPDGQVPFTAAAKARLGIGLTPPRPDPPDNPESQPAPTRCLVNHAAGAPMIGGADANLFQIVQTHDHVAIFSEAYHDVRMVRLGAGLTPDAHAGAWLGDSVGHWEGQTLVVETAGFHPGDIVRGGSLLQTAQTRVTERFTREGPDSLFYQFTVSDPTLYTQPWRGEMALDKAPGRIFEFACHEGNYAMAGILAGGRREEGLAKVAAK